MIPPIDPTTLPGPAQKIVGEGAPAKLQLMAARGIVPGLRPDALLSVLVLLTSNAEQQVAQQAQQTLEQLPEPLLQGSLDSDLPEAVIFMLAQRYVDRMDVIEKLVQMPRLPIPAVQHLASHGSESVTELISTNEERMLANPVLIEAIYMNANSRMSTSNRLVELAVRNGIELGLPAFKEISQAIKGELISEPTEEPLPEDQLFWEQHDLAEQLASDDEEEDAFYETEEGEETLVDKFRPLYQQLAEMTVAEKIRRAMLGSREERLMLIREHNKVVSAAAARSPLLQEPEVALVTRSRGVNDEVLRIIAMTPEWMKSYQIKRNLVSNAKTPIAIAQRLVTHMREADLRRFARDKNISGAVRQQIKRHLDRRKK